ncbi:MAG: phage minor capsid protein [[Eubacterium] siraeum]|nr:phage minor capsid protein [[Eubacterium] siraeum]
MLSFRDIARIFEEIELRLIASLKRNLSRHKAEEEKEGFEWSAWQAEKLNNIDNFRKDNVQIADEYVDVIDDGTRQLMTDQFHEGEHTAEQSVIDVSESGVNVPDVPAQPQPPEAPTAIPDDHFFGVNKPKMDKLMEDVTTLEKTALTAAVRNMDDVYRTTLNKVQLMMGTGSITLNEAIDLATRDFLDKGINCIVYADGRRVNIADYVRMALRTTSTRATLQGAAKRFGELGYDTVLISQYGGCSETCEPYQGKVYIDDVFTIWNGERSGDFGKSNYCDKWFMLLSVAIRGGLFHPNCRHTMGQYIEGLTKIPQPIPAEKIREQRALEEKQRAMERKIRALKRKIEGTQDEKKVKEYKRKLREEQGKLREFIKEHDDVLRRDYSREKIYSGEGKPKQEAPRTEEAPVKATDAESNNPVPTDKEPYVSKPDNNVSEPENNENTMNFVQPEPLKTVQSNEETDDTPTAATTDEADETAETTENVQETVKQPVEATADSEESVQNFTDDTVDNSDESDIIEETDFEPLSADTVVPVLREDSNEWINRLSPEEIRAIKKYTKNSGDPKDDKFYARLNSMLRGDIPEDDTLKYYSDVISGAIAKFELKHDIICYRSVKHNPVEEMKVGDIYEPKQFISTSVVSSRTLKGDYNIVIIAKKGSKGAYIELLSKYQNQREFLFDKNLKYRILKIRNNKIVLEVII